ncbi:hypothetical protein HG536_0G03990 [Torulaspora globosa]|uniref:DNA endonuclease activator Ctp1 C-terminal domain-containing protein n=1 Tax=Torulaspora globosa TaxID=48254 RepID=A0A7G3ZM01_9SACH|nr:uncharacterized protein HG536_0G03990 [Torulaspora globosa]QLL34537.1 hypothetical protein HG536_0G03990 [Torulaspora globosa]
MILRSKLDVLLELDLLSLLAVQSDVTRLIEQKAVLLEAGRRNGHIAQLESEVSPKDIRSLPAEEIGSVTRDDSDEDDFLLTQFDQIAREKLLNKGPGAGESKEADGHEAFCKKPDLSSPLKGTQSLPDSLGSLESDLQIFPPKMKDAASFEINGKSVLQSSNGRIPELSPGKRQKIKKSRLDDTVRPKSLVSFNSNPLTKKPWILEDFRLNEDLSSVKRGRKKLSTMKLNNFYEQGGRPPDVEVLEEAADHGIDNSCEFENLRQRSKSPPGFGRLDFPSTQERVDDKKKSQEIIHRKTRHRFLAATRCDIPQQERQYLFKSDYLNQLVKDGTFKWDDKNLKIFSRR